MELQDSSSSLLEKLPTETRLQIYEYLLHFDYPLRRIGSVRTANAAQTAVRAKTSILLVCRQVHKESIDLFYKLNTISIYHADICLKRSTSSPQCYDAELLVSLTLRGWWNATCENCDSDGAYDSDRSRVSDWDSLATSGIESFIHGLGTSSCPKLSKFLVDLRDCEPIIVHSLLLLIEKVLQANSVCTSVGRWQFTDSMLPHIQVEILHPPVCKAWAYFGDLPAGHIGLAIDAPSPDELQHFSSTFVDVVRRCFRAYHHEVNRLNILTGESHCLNSWRAPHGVRLAWIEIERQATVGRYRNFSDEPSVPSQTREILQDISKKLMKLYR